MLTDETSKRLRGFAQHGVVWEDETESQAVGSCPFCGAPDKFYASIEKRLWDCKRCGEEGNWFQFLGKRQREYHEALTPKRAKALARDRGLRVRTVRAWGVGWDGQRYTIAKDGNPKRRMTDVQRYRIGGKLLNTAGGKASLHVAKKTTDARTAWLCEGVWDAMALWEILRARDIDDEVLAVPGANIFPKHLAGLFERKKVVCVYDHDQPGWRGAAKAERLLAGVADDVAWVHWPKGAAEGYDLRDYYVNHTRNARRTYDDLLELIADTPPGASTAAGAQRAEGVQKKRHKLGGKGLRAETVEKRYREWLELPSTEALDIVFGTCFANRLDGDPLWLFLVGPPGSAKSELLMSLDEAPRVVTTTSLTPATLISGASFAGGGDPSLIPQLDGKVLVIKDFTAILSLNTPAVEHIFGTLRDAYDGRVTNRYGTGVVRSYKSKFGLLAGVTPAVEASTTVQASLGERFLKYRIGHTGHAGNERQVIRQALANIESSTEMRESLADAAAKALGREVKPKKVPTISEKTRDRIVSLAQWVAALRGVVSKEKYTGLVQYQPTREIGTRLAKQLAKLAYGIAIYRRRGHVSEQVYRTVVSVARSTAPDRVEALVRSAYVHQEDAPHGTKDLAGWANLPVETTRYLMEDLTLLKVFRKSGVAKKEYSLTPNMLRLMRGLGIYRREVHWVGGQNKGGRRR